MALEIDKLPKGNPPKMHPDQLIIVWGKKSSHMGPRDIVDPSHMAYDETIDDPDMWNPKTVYGQQFLGMVDSMLLEVDGALQGVRVPISVAKDGSTDGYVVAGRWRTLAAREATKRMKGTGTIMVPFSYVSLQDKTVFHQIVIENLGKRDLKPTQKAAYIVKMESRGFTREQIMGACCVTSWQAVENIKKLNDLVPEVKELVDAKVVTQTEARAIADKPVVEQKAIAEKKRTTGGDDSKPEDDNKRISPRDMRRIADSIKSNAQIPAIVGELFDYALSGDLSKIQHEDTRKAIENALKAKKRGPQSNGTGKTDKSEVAYQVQLAAVKGNGWHIRAALMESIKQWEDEGNANANNPDSPDIHCYDQSWYEQYSKMWRKDFKSRDDKTQSEGAFLKEWIRNLKE